MVTILAPARPASNAGLAPEVDLKIKPVIVAAPMELTSSYLPRMPPMLESMVLYKTAKHDISVLKTREAKTLPITPRELPKKGPRRVQALSTLFTFSLKLDAMGSRNPSEIPQMPPTERPLRIQGYEKDLD